MAPPAATSIDVPRQHLLELAPRRSPLATIEYPLAVHEDERRHHGDVEGTRQLLVILCVYLDDAEALLLRDAEPRHETRHPPRRTRASVREEEQEGAVVSPGVRVRSLHAPRIPRGAERETHGRDTGHDDASRLCPGGKGTTAFVGRTARPYAKRRGPSEGVGSPTPSLRRAEERARRIRHERSSARSAVSSPESPRFGRASNASSVRPSRHCSITAGLTYEARATAGVLPSSDATLRITEARMRRSSASDAGGAWSASARAAASVPPQVLKSFAVKPAPRLAAMYSLSSGAVRFAGAPVALEAQQPRAALVAKEVAHRIGQVGVDDRRPHDDSMLAGKAEGDALAAHRDVPLEQGGDPVRSARPEMALGADAEPGLLSSVTAIAQAQSGSYGPSAMCRSALRRMSGSRSPNRTGRSNFFCSPAARNAGSWRYWRRPAASTPVAWSFAREFGEIQTSRHAGGIASASMRPRRSSSTGLPMLST